ncbi:MAG: helix-turn-helix domain-containing protein [Helicobacteraceae bacterium]|nr:helix-turn-helix domain-containing protein [Helicobacteraceae bacterium]
MRGELHNSDVARLYKQIGANVKRIRTEKKISQLELSVEMGLKSVSLVSKAEIALENKHFNLEHLARIAYIFGVDIREFFNGVNPIKPTLQT